MKKTTKKQTHPTMKEVTFTCAGCTSTYKVTTTLNATEQPIDICSNCHPFYKGSNIQQVVKGRAEKLSVKFETGKTTVTSKPPKIVKKHKEVHKPKTFADL